MSSAVSRSTPKPRSSCPSRPAPGVGSTRPASRSRATNHRGAFPTALRSVAGDEGGDEGAAPPCAVALRYELPPFDTPTPAYLISKRSSATSAARCSRSVERQPLKAVATGPALRSSASAFASAFGMYNIESTFESRARENVPRERSRGTLSIETTFDWSTPSASAAAPARASAASICAATPRSTAPATRTRRSPPPRPNGSGVAPALPPRARADAKSPPRSRWGRNGVVGDAAVARRAALRRNALGPGDGSGEGESMSAAVDGTGVCIPRGAKGVVIPSGAPSPPLHASAASGGTATTGLSAASSRSCARRAPPSDDRSAFCAEGAAAAGSGGTPSAESAVDIAVASSSKCAAAALSCCFSAAIIAHARASSESRSTLAGTSLVVPLPSCTAATAALRGPSPAASAPLVSIAAAKLRMSSRALPPAAIASSAANHAAVGTPNTESWAACASRYARRSSAPTSPLFSLSNAANIEPTAGAITCRTAREAGSVLMSTPGFSWYAATSDG